MWGLDALTGHAKDVIDFLLTLKRWLEKLSKDFKLPEGHAVADSFEAAKRSYLTVEDFRQRDRALKGLLGVSES